MCWIGSLFGELLVPVVIVSSNFLDHVCVPMVLYLLHGRLCLISSIPEPSCDHSVHTSDSLLTLFVLEVFHKSSAVFPRARWSGSSCGEARPFDFSLVTQSSLP